MTEKYKEFMQWLKSYPVTDVQIKENIPEHYQKLQDAINDMDTAYYNDNLQRFTAAMGKVKDLYLEAMKEANLFYNKANEGI
jgi:hypothetical protein